MTYLRLAGNQGNAGKERLFVHYGKGSISSSQIYNHSENGIISRCSSNMIRQDNKGGIKSTGRSVILLDGQYMCLAVHRE